MKPSTKAELALNGMVELARRLPAKPMSLAVLAEKQAISLSYLEQVFAALRKRGLVLSVRGPGGGYLLAREARTISTGDIIDALDEGPNSSSDDGSVAQREVNTTTLFWATMHEQVLGLFRQVSLQDVIDGTFRNVPAELETTTQAAE